MEDKTMPDMPMQQPTPEVTPAPEVAPTPEAENTPQDNTEGQNGESIELINRFAPGSDTSTPEAIIEGQLKVLKAMVPIYDKLYDVALAAPEAASFLSDLLDTGSPVKALVRNYDPQEIQAALEDGQSGDHSADMQMHTDRVESAKTRQGELDENKKASEITAQAFMDKYEPTEEDVSGFTVFYDNLLKDAVNNKMTVEHWESMWQAYKYTDDVTEAEDNGRVIGRNEKIVTQKANKKESDTLLPEASGGITTPPKQEKPKSFASKFMQDF